VGGELDLSTGPALRSRIDELVANGIRRLIVNLQEVGFLDSSGLSVLVAARKRMQEAGGELALICANESVLKVFAVTNLDRVFAIYGSVAEATEG
jgi:anti-sigma B factor antagonist